MISIRCSELEAVRKNPVAHGQLLATASGPLGGGSHGMFAYFQDVAKMVHDGKCTMSEGVKELHGKFVRFNDTPANKKRQELLVEQFVKYCRAYEKNKFEFVDGWRKMKWDMTPDARLTGRTPWVVANNTGYFSYVLSEYDFDWRTELRFPLFQKYLVENTIDCHPEEMNVGIYCAESNTFSFTKFSGEYLTDVIKETKIVLETVNTEYSKRKK